MLYCQGIWTWFGELWGVVLEKGRVTVEQSVACRASSLPITPSSVSTRLLSGIYPIVHTLQGKLNLLPDAGLDAVKVTCQPLIFSQTWFEWQLWLEPINSHLHVGDRAPLGIEKKWSHSVMSDSLRPHGLQPTRLLCPWDFPGKSTGVGCYFLLQESSWPRDRTQVSHSVGRRFTVWATREVQLGIRNGQDQL